MASLMDYFVRDGAQDLTVHEKWPLTDASGTILGEITARLHLDFPAHAKYVSFFVPAMPGVECAEIFALNGLQKLLALPESVRTIVGFGKELTDARDLVFTGQVYLYSERALPETHRNQILREAAPQGHRITFRGPDYAAERDKWERPRAFISHDSRDKAEIAEPIAVSLQKRLCSVWYDQFSLKVGDSLRESIERGLKECAKCVLVLTPNFLTNGGWSRREYDSIFTRELVEKRNVILPVWHGVTAKDVYEYSPMLADRLGVPWSLGIDEVARKLLQAIDAP